MMNPLREGEVPVTIHGRQVGVDKEIADLVAAVNRFEGIQTIDVCAGHGERPVWIFFLAKDLECMPPFLYYTVACHTGVYGWRVVARTDCGMSPTSFLLESTTRGQEAYDEGKKLAEAMNSYFDEDDEDDEEDIGELGIGSTIDGEKLND